VEKNLKSVNIWQSYKQQCGCLMHFLAWPTLIKNEESAVLDPPPFTAECSIIDFAGGGGDGYRRSVAIGAVG